MSVQTTCRSDGVWRFEDVESELNKILLNKYERLAAASRFALVCLNHTGVKGMHWISRIPGLREFGTVHVTSILRKDIQ